VVDAALGTVKAQFVKIMDGTLDGTAKAAVGAAGLKVDASGAAVPITDNAGSLTVDGVFWQATQPVSAVAMTDGSQVAQLRPSTLIVTATAAVNTIVTATLPAVAGQFHYITSINIVKYASVATVGAAAPTVVTSTNLPGSLAWTLPTALAVGTQYEHDVEPASPIKSSVVNTASTVVAAALASIIYRITVYYYVSA